MIFSSYSAIYFTIVMPLLLIVLSPLSAAVYFPISAFHYELCYHYHISVRFYFTVILFHYKLYFISSLCNGLSDYLFI
ncbi:hypothetical protein BC943DRAFT_55644 [Umbelopsis sp. AD052]|nr:hypothetical protein BC943DRAFT_55644 [Umbelopsis sp. AD052]